MADDQAVFEIEAGMWRWRGLTRRTTRAADGCEARKRTKHGSSGNVVHVWRRLYYHARFLRVACFRVRSNPAAPPIKTEMSQPPSAMIPLALVSDDVLRIGTIVQKLRFCVRTISV
jgi:hypothetical protein